MLPQMQPYTPTLYQPDSRGRYRAYPHVTETPIPGAGYHVGNMFWGEQELNLRGSSVPQHHGNYSTVPLRGLGAETLNLSPSMLRIATESTAAREMMARMLAAQQGGGASPESQVSPEDTYGYDPAADIARAAAEAEAAAAAAVAEQAASQQGAQDAAQQAEQEGTPFLMRKAGPVPYWALGALGLVVVAGGGYVAYRKFKK
jgi:hypothetical protein